MFNQLHKYLKELGLSDKPYWQFDQSLADIKKDTNYQKNWYSLF